MNLFAASDETIAGTAAAIRSGGRSCAEVLERCLAQIDEREAEVRAWVLVDREGARAQAERLDRMRAEKAWAGPLHGIPIGVKDIIDVDGLPTAAGVPGWSGRVATQDAPIVAELRRLGAVVLGKTAATPYAWIDPPPTRNPWDLDRTPGGSSSGSAAAVAAGMCLGALGSQTGGSITRPAAYCGVAGFKPTFGTWSVEGVLPLAPSLDHPGDLARTVGDLAMLADVRPKAPEGPPAIGRLRGPFEDRADPAMRDAFEGALEAIAAAGSRVVDIALPARFIEVWKHHYTIMSVEAAAYHRSRREANPGQYPARINALIDDGLAVPAVDYVAARGFREDLRDEMLSRLARVAALACPSAPGPAPGPESTGDPAFNSPWSFLGVPTVGLPIAASPDGLPLGMQLVGWPGRENEAGLLGVAMACESAVRRAAGAEDLPPRGP